jgi:hypothetical protein
VGSVPLRIVEGYVFYPSTLPREVPGVGRRVQTGDGAVAWSFRGRREGTNRRRCGAPEVGRSARSGGGAELPTRYIFLFLFSKKYFFPLILQTFSITSFFVNFLPKVFFYNFSSLMFSKNFCTRVFTIFSKNILINFFKRNFCLTFFSNLFRKFSSKFSFLIFFQKHFFPMFCSNNFITFS